jgi:hypothetical protein
MRNAIRLLLPLVLTIILGGTSCVRYKASYTHTRDTVFVKVLDTTRAKPADSSAVAKVDTIIETVFMEVERDCPQKFGKSEFLKGKIKDACTMESLTGGELKAHSPDLKTNVRFVFKGNEPTAIWDIDVMEIQDKTENTVIKEVQKFITPPWWVQALNVWYLWAPAWFFIIFWLLIRFR